MTRPRLGRVVRTVLPCLVVLLLLPAVSAHTETGSVLTHLSVHSVALEPQQNLTRTIETGEGPWQKGMFFVINGFHVEGSWLLEVELLYNHSTVVNHWDFFDQTVEYGGAVIPHDNGPYELRFTNHGPNRTFFRYFFDQSCLCTVKPIGLNQGMVLFAYDFQKGRRYDVGVPLVEGWTLKGEMATLSGNVGDLEDLRVYEKKTATGPDWLNFTIAPPQSRTFYFFYTAVAGARLGTQDTLTVTVLVEDTAHRTPGFTALTLLGAVAWMLIRRRQP